jgi:hypothetical protein
MRAQSQINGQCPSSSYRPDPTSTEPTTDPPLAHCTSELPDSPPHPVGTTFRGTKGDSRGCPCLQSMHRWNRPRQRNDTAAALRPDAMFPHDATRRQWRRSGQASLSPPNSCMNLWSPGANGWGRGLKFCRPSVEGVSGQDVERFPARTPEFLLRGGRSSCRRAFDTMFRRARKR